jgi:uncharacterized membrane protein (DUF106 family)
VFDGHINKVIIIASFVTDTKNARRMRHVFKPTNQQQQQQNNNNNKDKVARLKVLTALLMNLRGLLGP